MNNTVEAKVSLINSLLEEAKENYKGVWDSTHTSRMNQIYYYIDELNKETGKRYIINGTELVLM